MQILNRSRVRYGESALLSSSLVVDLFERLCPLPHPTPTPPQSTSFPCCRQESATRTGVAIDTKAGLNSVWTFTKLCFCIMSDVHWLVPDWPLQVFSLIKHSVPRLNGVLVGSFSRRWPWDDVGHMTKSLGRCVMHNESHIARSPMQQSERFW